MKSRREVGVHARGLEQEEGGKEMGGGSKMLNRGGRMCVNTFISKCDKLKNATKNGINKNNN